MENQFSLFYQICSFIIQSLVICLYIFGTAFELPKLTKKMPTWKIFLIALVGAFITGFTISANMYIQSH